MKHLKKLLKLNSRLLKEACDSKNIEKIIQYNAHRLVVKDCIIESILKRTKERK